MKAEYNRPEIEVIEVEVSELMAMSGGDMDTYNLGLGGGDDWNEEKSNKSIWD